MQARLVALQVHTQLRLFNPRTMRPYHKLKLHCFNPRVERLYYKSPSADPNHPATATASSSKHKLWL
ncbi:hypothetical protein E2562_007898 [Oryza meyeriana var. granulata]|uniref:Uncharacterized protein n=1 Tax=Oryza meyeriana var. granulata TaxID=110450 RepID=A0A6G1DWY6_9ORYZ|nr:hypothetical protein E2562_007898 [Oryza meyeriana var. granulata]